MNTTWGEDWNVQVLNARRILVLAVIGTLCMLLAGCPSVRHGAAGQLELAREQCQSAVRTGVFAIDLHMSGRATRQAAAVQLGDAQDQVANAYKGVAVLTAGSDHELHLQRELIQAMAHATAALNDAGAVVRGVDNSRSSSDVRRDLLSALGELSAGAS